MERRKGQPRTEKERKTTHRELYGYEELPPRGTGLERHSSNPTGSETIETEAKNKRDIDDLLIQQ